MQKAEQSFLSGWKNWSGLHYPPEFEIDSLRSTCEGLSSYDVLEIGCGDGRVTSRLAQACNRVTGIDTDRRLIEGLNESQTDFSVKKPSYIEMSGLDLKFPSNSFDLVVYTWSLHDIEPPEATLKQAYRCLKPGGRAIIFSYSGGDDYDTLLSGLGVEPPARSVQLDKPVTTVFGNPPLVSKIGELKEYGLIFNSIDEAVESFRWALLNWHEHVMSAGDAEKLRSLITQYRQGRSRFFLSIKGELIVTSKDA